MKTAACASFVLVATVAVHAVEVSAPPTPQVRGTASIAGRVTAADTGRPIAGASVITASWESERLTRSLADWRNRCGGFSDLAGTTRVAEKLSLRFVGKRYSVHVAGVSDNYFRTLGLRPLAGRWLSPDPERGRTEAVISRAFWQDSLGSQQVLGRDLLLEGGVKYLIVGVAPNAARVVAHADVWLLLNFGQHRGGIRCLDVVGRLKPGVALGEIRTELVAASQQSALEHPDTNVGWEAAVEPLATALARERQAGMLSALFGLSCAGVVTAVLWIKRQKHGLDV
jgi:hypothetical protein